MVAMYDVTAYFVAVTKRCDFCCRRACRPGLGQSSEGHEFCLNLAGGAVVPVIGSSVLGLVAIAPGLLIWAGECCFLVAFREAGCVVRGLKCEPRACSLFRGHRGLLVL